MLFKGSGSMKMNDEDIKKYTEAISKNSDNLATYFYARSCMFQQFSNRQKRH